MSCITSPSFAVLINGEPTNLFGETRGFEKGDPLAPYLFILMVEGLGIFLKSQVRHGLIQGWKWRHGIPPSSHLQFVDDTSLMSAARIQEATSFQRALDIYVKASGQKISEEKSHFFSSIPLLLFKLGLL